MKKFNLRSGTILILSVTVSLASCGRKSADQLADEIKPAASAEASRSLPLAPIDMTRVKEIAEMLPDLPKGFGENYHNREAWEKLASRDDYKKILESAEEMLVKPFPAWNDEAYLTYFTLGTRPEGEKMLRDRSGWLSPLVLAECMENKERFIPVIEMVLKELLSQKSWVLPAHDRGKQNFEGRTFHVDLNAAGFAHVLGQTMYLLDDKLSQELRKAILDELYKRVFNPVTGTIEGKNKDHSWLTTTSNWNAVCLAGVTGAALAAIPEKEIRAKFAAIAERYSKNSVAGFTDDGYCTEGLGYFAYGFGHYIVLREKLIQASGGRLDLFADEKVKRIAAYAPSMEIMNNVYPSIADCRVGVTAPPEILWYCSRSLGLGLLRYDTLKVDGSAGNIVTGMMYAFPNSASVSTPASPGSQHAGGIRSYFNHAGVLIVRPNSGSKANLAAALKGGNNNEHHNHNDVGSYTIVVGDELLMGDPGGPFMYRSNTFGSERYTAYKNLASYGHPVPLVAGREQFAGRAAEAKIVTADFSDKKDIFSMDISSAYDVPGLKLIRTFTFSRKGKGLLTVEDDFSFDGESTFETALITRAICKEAGKNKLEFTGTGNRMIATISSPVDYELVFEKFQQDYPEFTRIGIRLKDPLESGKVKIEFRSAD